MSKIKTSSDLRKILAQTIEQVKTGAVSIDQASVIARTAEQINGSIIADVQLAKAKLYRGKVGTFEI